LSWSVSFAKTSLLLFWRRDWAITFWSSITIALISYNCTSGLGISHRSPSNLSLSRKYPSATFQFYFTYVTARSRRKLMMKKLLFICSKNRLRSPTAEVVFSSYDGLEVESAGLDREAVTPLCSESITWADMIFVMEKSHLKKLSQKFRPWLKDKRVVCLNIPDEYEYMESALIELLKKKVLPLLGTFNSR